MISDAKIIEISCKLDDFMKEFNEIELTLIKKETKLVLPTPLLPISMFMAFSSNSIFFIDLKFSISMYFIIVFSL